jgi:secondary thiamine-phosphate synthase enzyme
VSHEISSRPEIYQVEVEPAVLKPADLRVASSSETQVSKRSRPNTVVNMRRLAFQTREPIQFLDITDEVVRLVRESGISDGIVTIVSRHTTAAVRIQEAEPLLLQDLLGFLHRLAPSNVHYQHNDFRIRTHHMHDNESPNGHSHCLQFLLGSSETVPVMDGELQLGQWQRIFLVELDGPRPKREVLVQTVGVGDDDAT